ncbi:MAG: GspE/PulE family protein [Tissierellia bacterium]|nr:GspE/PulE family protein [Tissierellia bacterium]
MEYVDKLKEFLKNDNVKGFVDLLFDFALTKRASDIHIESYSDISRIRFRIDGKLRNILEYEKNKHSQISTKIKIMAQMNISEKRLPQDGRIKLDKYQDTDFRISTLNTVNGEKVEIRILSFEQFKANSNLLGFSENSKVQLKKVLKMPYGMLIFSGPTGSGKSTSLYSLLNGINDEYKNIITVEDPVEYEIYGINQVAINENIGLSFHKVLRSILRQDPDIIMIGEIRDQTTAQIAVRSAITGHLVLTTLHTNDALSSIIRLKDLGVEEYLLSSSITAVASQRLVRKLCDCKKEVRITKDQLRILKQFDNSIDENYKIYKPCSCSKCNDGYLGREAVEEVCLLSDELKNLIKQGNFTKNQLLEVARKNGFKTMFENAVTKVIEGKTSFEEIIDIL